MADRELPSGWHHVAAVRHGGTLQIFIDGQLTAKEEKSSLEEFNLSNHQPLQIGFGQNDYFQGRLADVWLYRRALAADELKQLAQ